MKRKNKINILAICIVILFILFGLGEWKDNKDEEKIECFIEKTVEGYPSIVAQSICEELD